MSDKRKATREVVLSWLTPEANETDLRKQATEWRSVVQAMDKIGKVVRAVPSKHNTYSISLVATRAR